jgi:hypothetical protein
MHGWLHLIICCQGCCRVPWQMHACVESKTWFNSWSEMPSTPTDYQHQEKMMIPWMNSSNKVGAESAVLRKCCASVRLLFLSVRPLVRQRRIEKERGRLRSRCRRPPPHKRPSRERKGCGGGGWGREGRQISENKTISAQTRVVSRSVGFYTSERSQQLPPAKKNTSNTFRD